MKFRVVLCGDKYRVQKRLDKKYSWAFYPDSITKIFATEEEAMEYAIHQKGIFENINKYETVTDVMGEL